MKMQLTTRFLQRTALALAVVALGACSSTPDVNAALDQARSRVAAAQGSTDVARLAPDELKAAGAALRTAEQAHAGGAKTDIVDHLAYLATQNLNIAQETATRRAAQTVTDSAGAERDRMRLAQRTQEADAAQRAANTAQGALVQSQQSNAVQSAQLAQAANAAQDSKAALAAREAQLAAMAAQMRELNARKTERGVVVTLGDMLFSTGQARLQADSARTMDKLATFMKANPERRAAIEGYTDSVGSASSNQDLSDRRAQAVMGALVSLGVPNSQLTTEAFGESRPVASNDTADGRQMNRRVEVVFAPEAADLIVK